MLELARISLRVLGSFAIVADGEGSPGLRITSRKGCALIAYLAMHPEERLSREHVATVLWGDRPEANARQCLRQCILSLRHDLGAAVNAVLAIDADRIGLNTRHVTVDAIEFKRLAQSTVESDLVRAAELYRGEFLSDLVLEESFDAWARKTRSELDELAAEVFQRWAKLADTREDAKHAVAAVERLIAIDTLREDWQRLALRIYARFRGRGFALKYAEAVSAQLKVELGVEPEPATKALIDSITRGEILAISSPAREAVTPAALDALAHPLAAVARSISPDGPSTQPLSAFRAAADRAYRSVNRTFAVSRPVALAVVLSLAAFVFALVDPWRSENVVAKLADWLSSSDSASHRSAGKPIAAHGVISIIVLPFTTDDATGANQKVADGITDDLINVLSRSGMLRVISRQTAFTYQGRAVDAGAVGAELGVRYVVEGSIKYAGSRFAINVDLVDTATRLQVWADRIEWDTSDQLTARDELAMRIANELKIEATVAEGARAAQDHAAEPDVDALLTHGLAIHYRGVSRENLAEELALFEEALRREPDLQPAAIAVAMSLTTAVLNSLSDNPDADLNRADELLDRAMQMDPNSYRVYFWKGLVSKARRNFQTAYELLSKAIDINPSATYAHAHLGDVLVKLGRPQEGLDHIHYAIRLSPKDPISASFYISAAEAELELHHEEAAIDWLQRAIASQPRNPSSYKFLAAAYALLGNKADAARNWEEFRKLSVASGLDRVVTRVKSILAARVPRAPSRVIQGLALVGPS
ncbi:MAG: tetratricopeptide repeat protein [Bradyrhizobiaceae bacterium]|nr:tetratricopeptide repeat protein [Bradyrhizobiaceae bacterium]